VANLPANALSLTAPRLRDILLGRWGPKTDEHADRLIEMTWQAHRRLADWA